MLQDISVNFTVKMATEDLIIKIFHVQVLLKEVALYVY